MKVGELLFDVNVNGDDAKKSIEGIKSGFGRLTDFAKGTAVAITGVASAILGISKSAVNSAVEIDNMSKKFGMSSDKVQELQLRFEQNNLSVSDMAGSLDSISSKMADYASTGQNAFAKLGISMRKSNGDLKTAGEVQQEIFDNINQMPKDLQRSALESVGQSAQLVNMLGASKADTKGKIVSKADIQGLNDLGTEMTKLEETSKTTFNKMAASLVPVIKPLVDDLMAWLIDMQKQIPKITEQIKHWLPILLKIGEYLLIFIGVTKGLSIFAGILGTTVSIFKNLAFLIRPILALLMGLSAPVAIFLAVLAGGIALFEAYENNFLGFKDMVDSIGASIKKWFVDSWASAKDVFSSLGTALEGMLQFDPSKMIDSIKSALTDLYNFFNSMLMGIPDMLVNTFINAIKGMFISFKPAIDKIGGKLKDMYDAVTSSGDNIKLDNSGATMSTTPLSTSNSLITNNQSSQINNDHSNKSKTTTNNIYITGDSKQGEEKAGRILSHSTGEN